MPISEQQLVTWGKQGPTSQFTSTYNDLKDLLNSNDSPFSDRDFTVFLQGSYKNDTNVYGDSDVDIIIRLNQTFYTDLGQLSEEDKILWEAARTGADYTVQTFKDEVHTWLRYNLGADVNPTSKVIKISQNGKRREADILVCAKLRRYFRFKNWDDQSYIEGIRFFLNNGSYVDNFPEQHFSNNTRKNQSSNSLHKHTIRIFKNLRNTMVTKGFLANDLAPSYFIEGLIYNVPDTKFGGTEQQNFYDVLSHLNNTDRSKFLCVNECYYLFHPTSPVTWREQKCNTFLEAVNTFTI